MRTKTPPRKKGRPNKGISNYKQLNVYVSAELLERLDRHIEQEMQRTGLLITRADVIRQLIAQELERLEQRGRRRRVVGGEPLPDDR
jgi:hypothetical protein